MESITLVRLKDREILLLGTAHVSKDSVADVERAIEEESPDHVCIEIDESRYQSISEGQNWERLNIYQVLRQKKGFLLMGNLVLSSFQRRMGLDLGVAPGAEMIRAVEVARERNIAFSFCDREIQTTLRRAWRKTGFWGKSKMLASLLSSVLTNEKLGEEDIERLKNRNALEEMMAELAEYLPSVKRVLIDERDQYLATRIFQAKGTKILAVVGAGHRAGIAAFLQRLDAGTESEDLSSIDFVPDPSPVSRVLPWVVPAAVAFIIGAGFVRSGWQQGLEMLWLWILVNGSLAAAGALAALAHPLTILVSFLAAPITSMNPTIGVGFVSGIVEAVIRKPRVADFNRLQEDIASLRGFYRNRVTHALVVFFLSSIGSAVGTFIGIPWLTSLLAG
jgi:pheromone shutdown-related protein TraB